MNVEQESEKLMKSVESLNLQREGKLRALIVNYADERVKQHNKDLVEKVEEYFGHLINDGSGKQMSVSIKEVSEDVLKIIKRE